VNECLSETPSLLEYQDGVLLVICLFMVMLLLHFLKSALFDSLESASIYLSSLILIFSNEFMQVLAPTTPEGVAALSAAFVDEATGDLKWDRLSALLSDPTKGTAQQGEKEEGTAAADSSSSSSSSSSLSSSTNSKAGTAVASDAGGGGDASAFVKPLTDLLLEPQDGKALRRLVHSQLKTKVCISAGV